MAFSALQLGNAKHDRDKMTRRPTANLLGVAKVNHGANEIKINAKITELPSASFVLFFYFFCSLLRY
jgi:hypothetical protein